MSSQLNWLVKTFKADGDLSDKLYYLARISDNKKVNLCNASTRAVGVIVEPAGAGKPVGIALSGIVKVIAGDAISAGSLIVSDANGKAIARTDEDAELICGIALEASANAGDEILIKLF